MRELLILGPLNIVLSSFVMIVMVSSWPVSESLLELELDFKLRSGWLSPPMVVLEEHVVQMQWVLESWGNLVHMWWNVADLVNLSGSDLSDMHVDHQTIVAINLHELFLGQVFGIQIVLNVGVLVRQDDIRVSELVAWSLDIGDSHILFDLVGIIAEIEIGVRCDLIKSVRLEGKLIVLAHPILEAGKFELLLYELIDLLLDSCHLLVIPIFRLSQL